MEICDCVPIIPDNKQRYALTMFEVWRANHVRLSLMCLKGHLDGSI